MGTCRRIFAVAALIFLIFATAACSTAGPGSDSEKIPTAEMAGSELELPMPEGTRLAIRVDPQRLEDMVAPSQEAGAFGEREALPLAKRLIDGLLQGRSADYYPDHYRPTPDVLEALDSLDKSRAVVAALSTRTSEEHLFHLRNGIPPVSSQSSYQGMSWRLFIPADNVNSLLADLEATRDEGKLPAVVRLSNHGDYVVADVHRVYALDEPTPSYDDVDATYWQRYTPALAEFLDGDAAAAIYVRNEDIPLLGALWGSYETLMAIEMAVPQHRQAMLARGFEVLGQVFQLDSPQVRESEDLAISLKSADDGGLVVDVARTHTEVGRQWTAGDPEAFRFSRVAIDDPLIQWSWAPAQPGGEQLGQPVWMSRLGEGEAAMGKVAELFRYSGIWAYGIVAANYPRSFATGIQRLLDDEQIPVDLWRDAVAMQGVLAMAPGADGGPGLAMTGQISALIKPGDDFDDEVEELATVLGQFIDAELTVHSEAQGEYRLIDFRLGTSEHATEHIEVQTGRLDIGIDNPRVDGNSRGGFSLNSFLERRQLAQLFVQGVNGATFRHRTLDHGSITRLRIGTDDDAMPVLAPTDAAPIEPSAESQCLVELRGFSQELLKTLGSADTEALVAGYDEFQTEAEPYLANCDDAELSISQEMGLVIARWKQYFARRFVTRLDWDRGLTGLDEACQSGAQSACDDITTVQQLRDETQLPQVAHASAQIGSFAANTPVLTAAGVSRLMEQDHNLQLVLDATEEELDQLAEADQTPWRLRELLMQFPLHRVETGSGRTLATTVVYADRHASATLLGTLVELIGNRDRDSWREQAQTLGKPGVAEDWPWIALAVDGQDDAVEQSPLLLFASSRHLERRAGDPIELALAGDTSTIGVDGDQVAQEGLIQHLSRRDWEGRPTFIIAPDEEVTIDEIAALHATVGAWADEYHQGMVMGIK